MRKIVLCIGLIFLSSCRHSDSNLDAVPDSSNSITIYTTPPAQANFYKYFSVEISYLLANNQRLFAQFTQGEVWEKPAVTSTFLSNLKSTTEIETKVILGQKNAQIPYEFEVSLSKEELEKSEKRVQLDDYFHTLTLKLTEDAFSNVLDKAILDVDVEREVDAENQVFERVAGYEFSHKDKNSALETKPFLIPKSSAAAENIRLQMKYVNAFGRKNSAKYLKLDLKDKNQLEIKIGADMLNFTKEKD